MELLMSTLKFSEVTGIKHQLVINALMRLPFRKRESFYVTKRGCPKKYYFISRTISLELMHYFNKNDIAKLKHEWSYAIRRHNTVLTSNNKILEQRWLDTNTDLFIYG